MDNPERHKRKLMWATAAALMALFILGVSVYSNTFFSPLHFDDAANITNNPAIRNLRDLKAIWDFWPSRFITYFSFAINYRIHQLDVLSYHLFNLAIHLGSGILLWWLLLLTFSTPAMKEQNISRHARLIAFFISLLFLVHPVQIQGVTYIVQRATSMAAFFYLASLGLYVKSRLLGDESPPALKKICYGASLASAIMAMFTKEMAVSLPLAILLYELSFLKDKRRFNWKYTAPFLMTLFIIPLTMFFTRSVNFGEMRRAVEAGPGISSTDYLLTQFRVMVTYIRLVFFPFNQNVDYDYPIATTLLSLPVLASLLFLSGLIIAAIKLFRNYRLLSFGILFFFLALLPESSIIPIKDVIFEHRLYLPLAGFSIFLVSALYYLVGKKSLKSMSAILVMIIAFYSALAYARNSVWKEEFTLWNDTVRKSPGKARPHLNLGNTYKDKGDPDQALVNYDKAIRINPNYADAYSNRGLVYGDKGNFDQAMADYNKAIKITPSAETIYYNRGLAYQKNGDLGLAIVEFNKAIELNPDYADAYNNRGLVHENMGDFDLALADYNKAIELNPDSDTTYYNRGLAYKNRGDLDRALPDYNKAIELNPGNAEAHSNRGVVYQSKGNLDRALSDYNKAIELNPDCAEAYSNRGAIYQVRGNLDRALADYNKAVDISPAYPGTYLNRAIVYLEKRSYNKSWDDLHRAQALGYEVNPEFIEELKKASGREK